MLICSPARLARGRRLRPNPGTVLGAGKAAVAWFARRRPPGCQAADFGYCPTDKTLRSFGACFDGAHSANGRRIPRNAHQLGGRQKEDARHGPSRISEPMLYRNGAVPTARIEHAAVPIDVSPHAPVLR